MRASNNIHLYSIILLCLATFTAAWPWPRWLPEIDSLVVRQESDTESSTNAPQKTPAPASTGSSSPKETGSNTAGSVTAKSSTNTGKQTGSQTNSPTGTQTNSNKGSQTTKKAHSSAFDARLPAGGVSMLVPNARSTQYYKVGDFVTFAWNYTSLLATPTAINIVATCTANQQLYTLAANQTVTNATGAVTWDTGAYQSTALSAPLLTETYTLIIYDAASSISATAQAGYLAVYNQFQFGMYLPQPYVPLADFVCATCSGALGELEKRALGMAVGVAAITVLSFTWFVGGAGVIW